MFTHTKPLADFLTVSRALLGICLAWLGMARGVEALPTAVLVVIISWLTDVLDGPLARYDPEHRVTWLGEHDAEADLAISLGVTAYLVLSAYLAGWMGAVLVLTILGLWVLHSHQLAWPFYALPYVILILLALQDAPLFGWLALGYLLATPVVCWPRFWQQYLPEFFQAIDSLHRGNGQHTPNAHNGWI
jgi:phosphatidylglycerophosphate synthase